MKAVMTMSAGYSPVSERNFSPSANAWLGTAKSIALFVAAPLIGLVYAVAFPFVGLAMLAWLAVRAMPKKMKNVLLFFASPFIGLAEMSSRRSRSGGTRRERC
jgi:hypothetical protein